MPTTYIPHDDVPSECARVAGVAGCCTSDLCALSGDEDGPSAGWGIMVAEYEGNGREGW